MTYVFHKFTIIFLVHWLVFYCKNVKPILVVWRWLRIYFCHWFEDLLTDGDFMLMELYWWSSSTVPVHPIKQPWFLLGKGVKWEPKYYCRIFEQPLIRYAELQMLSWNRPWCVYVSIPKEMQMFKIIFNIKDNIYNYWYRHLRSKITRTASYFHSKVKYYAHEDILFYRCYYAK